MAATRNELRYWQALKQITQYHDPSALLKKGKDLYGVSGEEALVMAYENMQEEAKSAIRGRKRPVLKVVPKKSMRKGETNATGEYQRR